MDTLPLHTDQIRHACHGLLGDAVALVMVFGSCASGKAGPLSDLDIAVDAGQTLTTAQQFELIQALAQATGRPIDLIDLRRVGEPLLGQILNHGRRIMGTDHVHAQYMTRHVMDVADFVPLQQRVLEERRQAWIGK